VAGIIAAQDNGNGVVGVAPQASLHIVRVIGDTVPIFGDADHTNASYLIVAINACANANANIISMSYAGENVSRVYNLGFYMLDFLSYIPHRLHLVVHSLPRLNKWPSKHCMIKGFCWWHPRETLAKEA
jgi:Subtilase family